MQKKDVRFCVVIEKGKARTHEGSGQHHVRQDYIILENWMSIDKTCVMIPVNLLNPIKEELPKSVGPKYFYPGTDKVDNLTMDKRFKRFPFPLSVGFREHSLASTYKLKTKIIAVKNNYIYCYSNQQNVTWNTT
jgi:hypothetical protein